MPISFPSSPTTNQTYTYLGKTWTWTGAVWQANSTPMGPTGPTGPQGLTVTGPTGPTGPAVTSINAAAVVTTVNDIATSYTIVAGDKNELLRSTSASAITITVANVLAVGEQIDILQFGAGQITFAASGVTLVSPAGKLKTNVQYSAATLKCVASGVVALIGDLA